MVAVVSQRYNGWVVHRLQWLIENPPPRQSETFLAQKKVQYLYVSSIARVKSFTDHQTDRRSPLTS